MKFLQYINESRDFDSLKEIIDILFDKCQPFIKAEVEKGAGIRFMYSGRNESKDWMIKPIRKDRKPKDMPLDVHQKLDDAFYKKFKFRARSNALFVTGDKPLASFYGREYIIFPVGKYSYLYDPQIRDLFVDIQDYIKNIWGDFENFNDWDKLPIGLKQEFIKKWIAKNINNYTNKNLQQGIRSNVEVMLGGTEYVAILAERYERNLVKYFKDNGPNKLSDAEFEEWYDK